MISSVNDPMINKLIKLANKKNMKVRLVDFKVRRGFLKGNRIGLDLKLNVDDLRYTLAHELAHVYLHIDKGDIIGSPLHNEYEEQANRTANLIIDLLSLDCNQVDV